MSIKAKIYKNLGSFTLDVDFEAGDESIALLGASGCGKSLTLKCIAGIIKPDSGYIELDGRVLFDSEKGINLSPQQRKTGYLFQNYALFPNMTVLQNISCGAKREKDREKRQRSIEDALSKFGLTELQNRLPSQLSGGQQQRVALARILVSEPEILLLDEPFSALDSHLRFTLEGELRRLISSFGKSVILVSHDRDEVFRLSEKIAVMEKGGILKFGSRDEVFRSPGSRTGALLTGCKNISPLKRIDENHVLACDWDLELKLPEGTEGGSFIGIRMHDMETSQGENCFDFQIVDRLQNPFTTTLFLKGIDKPDAKPLFFELPNSERDKIGGRSIRLSLPPEKLLILD